MWEVSVFESHMPVQKLFVALSKAAPCREYKHILRASLSGAAPWCREGIAFVNPRCMCIQSSHVLPVSGVLPLHPSTRAGVVVSQLRRCVDWVEVGVRQHRLGHASFGWQELWAVCVACISRLRGLRGTVFYADPRLVRWGVARVWLAVLHQPTACSGSCLDAGAVRSCCSRLGCLHVHVCAESDFSAVCVSLGIFLCLPSSPAVPLLVLCVFLVSAGLHGVELRVFIPQDC